MKCDVKTMLKAGIWLAALVAGAYLVFPGARGWLLGMSPFLFFLLCPLMMIFMMKSMQSCHADKQNKNDATFSYDPIKDEKRSVNGDKTF
ncbi:DUF2933 domain-containing protein [Halopseudomonas bauzanensis]|uniref:DUF2933 domain-containing protein n=1 Tax=Halopseudomonas bauzanensis TaxID=653930 RepID=UPI003525FF14